MAGQSKQLEKTLFNIYGKDEVVGIVEDDLLNGFKVVGVGKAACNGGLEVVMLISGACAAQGGVNAEGIDLSDGERDPSSHGEVIIACGELEATDSDVEEEFFGDVSRCTVGEFGRARGSIAKEVESIDAATKTDVIDGNLEVKAVLEIEVVEGVGRALRGRVVRVVLKDRG